MRLKTAITMIFALLFSFLAYSQRRGVLPAKASWDAVGAKTFPSGRPLSDVQSYEILFRRIAYLQNRAAMREQEGKDGSLLRSRLAADLGLSPAENESLHRVSFDCLRAVTEPDSKAKAIIQEERAKFPGGRTTATSGRPTPPPILFSLQAERESVLLRARRTLQRLLGDSRFAVFDSMIKEYLTETSRQPARR